MSTADQFVIDRSIMNEVKAYNRNLVVAFLTTREHMIDAQSI